MVPALRLGWVNQTASNTSAEPDCGMTLRRMRNDRRLYLAVSMGKRTPLRPTMLRAPSTPSENNCSRGPDTRGVPTKRPLATVGTEAQDESMAFPGSSENM